MDFVEGREGLTFRISGHMNLTSEIEKIADFWSECTGLWDAETGCDARCVWRTVGGQFVSGGGRVSDDISNMDSETTQSVCWVDGADALAGWQT